MRCRWVASSAGPKGLERPQCKFIHEFIHPSAHAVNRAGKYPFGVSPLRTGWWEERGREGWKRGLVATAPGSHGPWPPWRGGRRRGPRRDPGEMPWPYRASRGGRLPRRPAEGHLSALPTSCRADPGFGGARWAVLFEWRVKGVDIKGGAMRTRCWNRRRRAGACLKYTHGARAGGGGLRPRFNRSRAGQRWRRARGREASLLPAESCVGAKLGASRSAA